MDHVRQATTLLAGRAPGKHWITRFLNRNPKLVARFTNTLDKDHVYTSKPEIINKHFRDLKRVIKGVEEKDIWNMDEKEFLMVLAVHSKVICTY